MRLGRRDGQWATHHRVAHGQDQARHQAARGDRCPGRDRQSTVPAAHARVSEWRGRVLGRRQLGAGHDDVRREPGRVHPRRDRSGSRGGIRRTTAGIPRTGKGGARMRGMFRAVLYAQWKWSRLIVVLGTVAGFAIPLLSVQGAARPDRGAMQTQELLRAVQSWGSVYPLLAAALGLLIAIAAWAADHRGRHIHALTLPLPRWQYVTLRFGAGLALLTPPIAAVLIGALLGTVMATLPPGLQAYPLSVPPPVAPGPVVSSSVLFFLVAGGARAAGGGPVGVAP